MTMTMYESKLLLNRQKIFNPLEIQEALASYFEPARAIAGTDFFYRLEWYKIGVVVPMIMYSRQMPVMKRFPELQLLETHPLPELTRVSQLDFKLFAVPDIKTDWETTDEVEIISWLQKELKGAAIVKDCCFGPNNCIYFNQDGIEKQQQTVTIKGTLQIIDRIRLENIRRNPVGKSTELGCGLFFIETESVLEAN